MASESPTEDVLERATEEGWILRFESCGCEVLGVDWTRSGYVWSICMQQIVQQYGLADSHENIALFNDLAHNGYLPGSSTVMDHVDPLHLAYFADATCRLGISDMQEHLVVLVRLVDRFAPDAVVEKAVSQRAMASELSSGQDDRELKD
ncbi:MAG: hypothetical protein KJT03_22685 [Verrucomicrobiae bacterium]|nr:hypothetical protein [Verrucomicrobiae bacterium]